MAYILWFPDPFCVGGARGEGRKGLVCHMGETPWARNESVFIQSFVLLWTPDLPSDMPSYFPAWKWFS